MLLYVSACLVTEASWDGTGVLQLGDLPRLQHGVCLRICPLFAGLEVGIYHCFSAGVRGGSVDTAHSQRTTQETPRAGPILKVLCM